MKKIDDTFTFRENRRRWLASLASLTGIAALRAADEPAIAGKRSMILHNDRPEDLETPLEYYNSWLTPNDAFFVRQHIPRPEVNADSFALTVNGKVAKELHLTLGDLGKLPQYTVPAVIECTGNGRGFYRPRVPGIQWMRGAIGNAEWTGPRLSDVLKLAGTDPSARFVEVNGADVGVAKTPDFVRSFPMKKALHPATLLALKMNGQPIPDLHGFPLRLIVPGWDGTSWVKWVIRITPKMEPNTGFFMNPAYRIPKYALPPGATPVPSELEVIEGMPVKSTITHPADQAKLNLGPLTIRGFAWAGEEDDRACGRFHRWRQPLDRGETLKPKSFLLHGACGASIGRRRNPATTPSCRARPILPAEFSQSWLRGIPPVISTMQSTGLASWWRSDHE